MLAWILSFPSLHPCTSFLTFLSFPYFLPSVLSFLSFPSIHLLHFFFFLYIFIPSFLSCLSVLSLLPCLPSVLSLLIFLYLLSFPWNRFQFLFSPFLFFLSFFPSLAPPPLFNPFFLLSLLFFFLFPVTTHWAACFWEYLATLIKTFSFSQI